MTVLIVMVWLLGFTIWALAKFGGPAADGDMPTPAEGAQTPSRRRHPSRPPAGEASVDEGNPVWSALDDHQLERLLRDASS
jgi:hypothetical protein